MDLEEDNFSPDSGRVPPSQADADANRQKIAAIMAVHRNNLQQTVIDEHRKARAKLILQIKKSESTNERMRERADKGDYPKSLKIPALTFPDFPTKMDFEAEDKKLRAAYERDSLSLLQKAHAKRLEYLRSELEVLIPKLETSLATQLANSDLPQQQRENLVSSLSADFTLECAKLDAEAKCKADAAAAAAAEAARAKNAENAQVERMIGEEQMPLISEIVRKNMQQMMDAQKVSIITELTRTLKATLNTSGNSRPPRGSPSGQGGNSGNIGKKGKAGKKKNAQKPKQRANQDAGQANKQQQKKTTKKKPRESKKPRPS
jgi:hypothetical protein